MTNRHMKRCSTSLTKGQALGHIDIQGQGENEGTRKETKKE